MTTRRKPADQAARERVVRDLDTSFAVEAGAGTGKTTVLTGRIIEAVRTGHAALGEIVAITFTERAASELRVRLRDEIERGLAEASGELSERLSHALAALDTAHASTIHSFAASILRERPVEAGVDPGFEVADELEASLLFDRVWSDWLAEQLSDEDGALRPALLAGLTTDQLKSFSRFLCQNPDVEPAGGAFELGAAAADFTRTFVPRAKALFERMRKECPTRACSCASRIVLGAAAAARLESLAPADVPAVIATIPGLGLVKPQKTCKDRAVRDGCLRELNELEELAAGLRGPAAHCIVCGLAAVLRTVAADYESAKRKRGLLDFDDLLVKARNVLRDNREVRVYFQRQFKMILVDECQDTDPLQTEIVLFLAEDGARAKRWQDVKVVPGKLLFVGDPKQSIYRFRRADIETYEEAVEVVAKSGERVHIVQNFRSSASCVGWVNAVFAELIQPSTDGHYQPDYVALDAWREDAAPAVTVLRPPEGVEFEKIDAAREAEAAVIAAELRRMVERADLVFDKPSGAMRPVRYGDVALLLRKRTALKTYEEALSAAGVPFRTVSGRDFFGRQEVAELRAVLAAIERPYDAVSIVAALRASLLAVSDEELAAVAPGRFNYLEPGSAGAVPHVERVFELLAWWHGERNAASLSRLVRQVLCDTKALELFYLKPNGEQRAANLLKVVDAARAFEQTSGATFGGFVRWLDERSRAAEEAESPLAEEGDDFVRIMTVHQAKGLEFPVVALPDLSGEPRGGINFVVNRREGTFDAQLGGEKLGIRTIGFDDAKEREKRVVEAEVRRLFYVAATRARDRIILPFFQAGNGAGGWLKYLLDLAEDASTAAGQFQVTAMASCGDLKQAEPRAFRANLLRKPPSECAKLLAAREKWAADRAELVRAASAGPALAAASALGRAEEAPQLETEEARVAAAIGTAVHRVLERVDLRTGHGVGELAAEEAARCGLPGRADEVRRLAEAALGADIVRRAAAAKKLYREVPFAFKAGGTLLEGIIDLAFEDAGIHIVDYKTDAVAEGEAEAALAAHAEGYRLQVGAYALAVREAFGQAPQSATLLFLRPGREVAVRIDNELMKSVCEAL